MCKIKYMKTLQEYYTTIDSVEFKGLTDESVIGLLPRLSPDEADFKKKFWKAPHF